MAPIHLSSAKMENGHATNGISASNNSTNPIILHLGDPIRSEPNKKHYERLKSQYDFVQPPLSDLTRENFIKHLKDKTWGNFSAIIRPHWNTGGEMGMWDRRLIELLPPSLKIIASAGAGFDWVRTDILAEYGILYTNGAGASTESVADMALFLILSVFRQMTWSSLAARSNDPRDFQMAHREVMYHSQNPSGHRLGIVGLGNIGFAVAKKMKVALNMKILYHDINQKSLDQEREVDAIYYTSLDDLLANSDCILLASPHGPPILTAHTLALLPQGARVVNIARGSLINEEALADALESGHISAAGLDVHTREPNPCPRLQRMNNVQLTCHTGGSSIDTIKGFERLVLENVERVLGEGEPLTAVNKQLLGVRACDSPNLSTERSNGIGMDASDNNIGQGMTNGRNTPSGTLTPRIVESGTHGEANEHVNGEDQQ